MTDCIFCKIVNNELPSYKIYEDENFLSFLDIFPKNEGHVLVIPKKHYRISLDVPDDVLRDLVSLTNKLTKLFDLSPIPLPSKITS